MEYQVTWTIDIEADTHIEAARIARETQLDRNSIGTHFVVTGEDSKPVNVDLGQPGAAL